MRRAQAAGDFIKEILPKEPPIPVYCWGAASHNPWGGDDNQSQILITVMNPNN
jgi:hypothetical protein